MGIIASLFGVNDNPKRIRKIEFEKSLKGMSQFTGQEKNYIRGVFGKDLKDGTISLVELQKELMDLKTNQHDPLSDQDVQRLKGKLSSVMIDKIKQ
ncbi:MAG: hypothetical protein NT058_00905 [Candidatus Portnoybacteria bacterium]|nr:hypothetical protein [Candidatus Portnoybacteria bacterium]